MIGPKNKGLSQMFTMMNLERIVVGIQGLGISEIAYQNSLNYAKERKQGKSNNNKSENGKADSIIELADLRNTLLNFPAQGNGSDILRQAIIKLHEAGFLINAPVHDALLISIPRGNEDKEVKIAQRIMEESAEFVIGNKIRVGIEKVDPHFKVKEKHKEIFNLIFKSPLKRLLLVGIESI